MNYTKSSKNEIEALRKERDLYAKLLKEANLLFEEKLNALSLVKRIGDIIGNCIDLDSFCRKLTDIILDETNAESCSLLLKDGDAEGFIQKTSSHIRNNQAAFFVNVNNPSTDAAQTKLPLTSTA